MEVEVEVEVAADVVVVAADVVVDAADVVVAGDKYNFTHNP